MSKKKKKQYFKIVFASCPECGKVIKRIGVFGSGQLIGYIGANCNYCKTFRKADPKKIDYVQLPFLKGIEGQGSSKTRVCRADN